MSGKAPPTRATPPVPPHFVRHFVEGGWREVERVYGCRTALMMTWIAMSGGLRSLQDRRRAYLRARMERARRNVALADVSRRMAAS